MRHAQNGYTDASMWQAWERSGLAGLCAVILARSGLDKATAERHILPMEKQPVSAHAVPVALARCEGYDRRSLDQLVGEVLDAARIAQSCSLKVGTKVLVKPNLLMGRSLACTSPGVVVAACRWLRDHGAQMAVADSPGFGRAESVACAIGLESALRPLGLAVRQLDKPVPITLPLLPGSVSGHSAKGAPRFYVASAVQECDFILSLPRVKAHSQMLLTLAVKNCFGCVSGLHKAVAHAREGRDPTYFADCLAALWAALRAQDVEPQFGTLGPEATRLDTVYAADGDVGEYRDLFDQGAVVIATDAPLAVKSVLGPQLAVAERCRR